MNWWNDISPWWRMVLVIQLGLVMVGMLVALLLWVFPEGWEAWKRLDSAGRDTIIIGLLLLMWVTRP